MWNAGDAGAMGWGRTYVCVGQEMPRAFGAGGGSWDALEFGWDAWEFRCDTIHLQKRGWTIRALGDS
jgi:hypothetical protein